MFDSASYVIDDELAQFLRIVRGQVVVRLGHHMQLALTACPKFVAQEHILAALRCDPVMLTKEKRDGQWKLWISKH